MLSDAERSVHAFGSLAYPRQHQPGKNSRVTPGRVITSTVYAWTRRQDFVQMRPNLEALKGVFSCTESEWPVCGQRERVWSAVGLISAAGSERMPLVTSFPGEMYAKGGTDTMHLWPFNSTRSKKYVVHIYISI